MTFISAREISAIISACEKVNPQLDSHLFIKIDENALKHVKAQYFEDPFAPAHFKCMQKLCVSKLL